jgi:hypothetical protein
VDPDPHQIERKDPDPNSHQSDRLDPDPNPDPHFSLQMTSQDLCDISLLEHFFSRIWFFGS